jgi:hypothetical protein
VQAELAAARQEDGTTFDWIVTTHGPGGDEAEDNVRLELA